MKKVFAVLVLTALLLTSGCRSQKDLHTSSDNSSSLPAAERKSESSADIPSSEETSSISSEITNTSSRNDSIRTSSTPTKKPCTHNYHASDTRISCTENGYIKYVCENCGNSYSKTVPPQHSYSKYLCDNCGKVDPQADKFWAVNAWLTKYGSPNGKGNMNVYTVGASGLSISNYLDQNNFFIEYSDIATNEQFSVFIQGPDISEVSFSSGSTQGYYTIKNSTLSSARKIVFDEFYTDEINPADCDVFATECAKKIDAYMMRFQNEILAPKMGLTLSDFGFTNYR